MSRPTDGVPWGFAKYTAKTASNIPREDSPMATRRDFLKSSAVAGGAALAANMTLLSNVHAGGSDVIKVGLIGCGGRGTGAAEQCVQGGANVKLVAMGDTFRDRLTDSLRR